MARSIDAIERDLDRTRDQLANTLDELAARANPTALADGAKKKATDTVQDPKVQAALAAAGLVVVGIVVLTLRSKRKRNKEIKEIQELLASYRNEKK